MCALDSFIFVKKKMDKSEKRLSRKLEALDSGSVVKILERWDMREFVDFVKEKDLDGRKLLDVTEGIVKLWCPKINANKFIIFIGDLKLQPEKYINEINSSYNTDEPNPEMTSIECQYQVVTRKKSKEESTSTNIEDLLKRIVPAKSFLYRNQQKKSERPTYLPMNPVAPKKSRKLFRINSYDYPLFDIRSRFKQGNNSTEKGYYTMKRNSIFYINKTYKKPEERLKYTSLPATDELKEKYTDDHFYEDLCYNEVESKEQNTVISKTLPNPTVVKPCIVKIQELFQSFKIPFFKRTEEAVVDKRVEVKCEEDKNDVHIYENNEGMANMYDSIHINTQSNEPDEKNRTKLPIEDYLEPVHINQDYVTVHYKQKDDSILGYIMSIFENRFGIRRETNDPFLSEDSESDSNKPTTSPERSEVRCGRSMQNRPLPVPVENETYYMNIDRNEAENLLRGQPDGMFVLRPSSQANHAYTLSVSCSGLVHNIGVRRLADGRLALGFARRGQRSFISVTSLLRHHRRRRLLLVADGSIVGATTLNDTPQYYQTPSSMPVRVIDA